MDPEAVLVLIQHPHGDLWISLSEWMKTGPGPRQFLRPTAAKDVGSGKLLKLPDVVPIPFRNDLRSRALIACRLIRDPWAHLRAAWASASKG